MSDHEHEVGKVLVKSVDGAEWKITNRMVDVDTDETLYRFREVGGGDFTEICTDSQLRRRFDVDDGLRADGGRTRRDSRGRWITADEEPESHGETIPAPRDPGRAEESREEGAAFWLRVADRALRVAEDEAESNHVRDDVGDARELVAVAMKVARRSEEVPDDGQ